MLTGRFFSLRNSIFRIAQIFVEEKSLFCNNFDRVTLCQTIYIYTVKQEDPGQLTTKMEVKEEPLSPTKPGTSGTAPSGVKSSKPQQSHKSENLKEKGKRRALKSEKVFGIPRGMVESFVRSCVFETLLKKLAKACATLRRRARQRFRKRISRQAEFSTPFG